MAFLTFVYKNGLWLSWPVFGLGVFLIVKSILLVMKLEQRNLILSVPLLAEQQVEFIETGTVALWVDGPLFSLKFLGLDFELRDSAGLPVANRRNLFPLSSTSFSRGRMLARLFTISHPGTYTLRVSGKPLPETDDGEHRLVFMRPYLAETVGCVLGILLGALLTIGSLVNFLLRLLSSG